MAIAKKLSDHLANAGVAYDVVAHPRTPSSSRTAQAAHVTGERVAKTVVLHDDQGYLLAVVPSTHRVELDSLRSLVDRRLSLATESEIEKLFGDCDVGAVPPVGAAYDLDVILDESLAAQPDVYIEAGDHESLLRLGAGDFAKLMTKARSGRFSHHV